MTDYLLVHGPGQGAWIWGRVWGRMTAPEEHPPRLHKARRANRVYPMDLPGHGADAQGDTGGVRLDDCVDAVVRSAEREGLREVVLVGHGLSAGIVLQAAAQLPSPPRRLVLVAGIVPPPQRSLLSVCPRPLRSGYRLLTLLSSLSRQPLKLPRPVIHRYLCNSMDAMEVVQQLGFFGALPGAVLQSRRAAPEAEPPCPVSYIILNHDRLITPEAQRRTAQRFGCDDTPEVDACHQAMWQKPNELAQALLTYA